MYHKNFWTVEKIGRRIQLLMESQVAYRCTVTLPASARAKKFRGRGTLG